MARKSEPSGMIVNPKLPVPQQPIHRPSAPNVDNGLSIPKLAIGLIVAACVGAIVGYLAKPGQADKVAVVRKEAATAQTAAKVEKDRAEGMQKQVDVLTKDKQQLETELAAASAKLKENEKKAEAANADAQKKLQAAVGNGTGEVSTQGEEIRLKLVDKVLFAVGDDQLTDKGKAVLAKVGKALTDLPDKQIWVQGHTDDSPMVVPPAPKAAKTPKAGKGKAAAKAPEETGPRFASNWELSAARALQVVHYLQDVAKIDPARLAALAFGQYRPVSKANKALNRRIEIVLYPHKAVIEK
jgi:chemotaxis protein MotB